MSKTENYFSPRTVVGMIGAGSLGYALTPYPVFVFIYSALLGALIFNSESEEE